MTKSDGAGKERATLIKRIDLRVAAIMLLALILRLWWVTHYHTLPFSDFMAYHERATGIAQGLGYQSHGQPTAYWGVGYPGFLGILYAIFGISYKVGKAANVLLGVLSTGLLYAIGRRLHSEAAGYIAALIYAVAPRPITYTSVLGSETLFTFMLLLWVAAYLYKWGGRYWPLVTGALLALATLVKPFALVLIPLIGLWHWVRSKRFIEAFKVGLVAAVGLVLTIAPWTIRNYIVLGGFVPVATNGGVVMWLNNNPEATGYYLEPKNDPFVGLYKPDGRPDEVAFDRRGREVAISWIRQNPRRFLQLGNIRATHTFLTSYDTIWALAMMEDGNPSPLQQPLETKMITIWDWERRLAYLGLEVEVLLLLVLRRRSILAGVLVPVTVVLAFFVIVFVFEGQPRYNTPLLPFWFLGIGFLGARLWEGAAWLVRYLRSRGSRPIT